MNKAELGFIEKLLKKEAFPHERASDTLKRILEERNHYQILSIKLENILNKRIQVGDEVELIELPPSLNFNWLLPEAYPLHIGDKGKVSKIFSSQLTCLVKWERKECSKYDETEFMFSRLRRII